MGKCIMVGCDLHDRSMLLKIAVDRDLAVTRSFGTDSSGRQAMLAELQRRALAAGVERVIFAYEACGFGFGLHDQLMAAGIQAYVLAPSKMERSVQHRKRKTDERDAQAILDIVRNYVLAGTAMPSVWIPDQQTRDDRELLRLRLATAEDRAAVRTKIRWLLKRCNQQEPSKAWSSEYWCWLHDLVEKLPAGAAAALASLLRQEQFLTEELQRLNRQVVALSRAARHARRVAAVRRSEGVGVLTAMVFLTELGDLGRFANRRQLACYLGLTPSSHESGEGSDRKGHITRQGPSRVRKVLCQAVWSRVGKVASEKAAYDRLVRRNPKHKKIAVVARMRALGIRMWHDAMSVSGVPAGGGSLTRLPDQPHVARGLPQAPVGDRGPRVRTPQTTRRVNPRMPRRCQVAAAPAVCSAAGETKDG